MSPVIIYTDLCIVGAGVAGISIAREFAGTGINVTVLESGAETPTRHARNLNNAGNSGTPYWSVGSTRGRQIGGTAAMWVLDLHDGSKGLRLRPLDPVDFEQRPSMPYSGWPIKYDDLSPFFARTEDLFQISGAEEWNPLPGADTFGADSPELRSVNFRLSPSTLFTDRYPAALRKAKEIRIVTGATATNLNTTENGAVIESVECRDAAGDSFKVVASNYVLACGGIETPRLMLLSTLKNDRSIGTATTNAGRFFMEHPHFVSGRIVPADKSWLRGSSRYIKHVSNDITQISKLTLSNDLIRSRGLPNFCIHLSRATSADHRLPQSRAYDAARILRSHLRTRSIPENISGLAGDLVRGLPFLSKQIAVESVRRITASHDEVTHLDLYYMSEQAPDPANRVTLSDKKDALGLPRAHLHWALHKEDFQGVLDGQKIMSSVLRKYNLGQLIPDSYDTIPPPGIRGGFHHMGTMRMSASPESGVVDKHCRVHGTSNLFVAGSSVFPTGGYANPTFTIGALALRLSDHLKGLYRQ